MPGAAQAGDGGTHGVPSNLPAPLTGLIGRERERAGARRLLADTKGLRLLTLTGPGGCGKSRLALAVAADLAPAHPEGVWLVELAALSDPALVPQAVAAVVGVREAPMSTGGPPEARVQGANGVRGGPLVEALTAYLRPRTVLLVLDNCEHLLAACARLAETLLRACPHLRVLATSRQALGIGGETVFLVPSLKMPDAAGLPLDGAARVSQLGQSEAVQLFVERAIAARSDFRLTPQNASAVAEVCRRLDGLPLAIELAAAGVKFLAAEQIATRLETGLRLPSSTRPTAPPRHQTLDAAIDWSHDLLTEPERELFRRLAVFAGGWTLEAAESVGGREPSERAAYAPGNGVPAGPDRSAAMGAVGGLPIADCELPPRDVLDVLSRLVERSLVQVREAHGEARYQMLDTIRQYAAERLRESNEAPAVRRRHRDYYLALAERAARGLRGREQADWLRRLDAEHDNLRQALAGYTRGARALKPAAATDAVAPVEDAEAGLRLGAALWFYWTLRSHLSEGRGWLARVLGREPEGPPPASARAAAAAARGAGSSALRPAVVYRAKALACAGALAWLQGDLVPARAYLEKSVALWRDTAADRRPPGWRHELAFALMFLGLVMLFQSDAAAARRLEQDSVALFREARDPWSLALALASLGQAMVTAGDRADARPVFEESLALWRAVEDRWGLALSTHQFAWLAYLERDFAAARPLFEEGLALFREYGELWHVAPSLGYLARIAEHAGDDERAQALLEERLAVSRDLGNKPWIAAVLSALGSLLQRRGVLPRAAACFTESLELFRELGLDEGVASSAARLAEIASAAPAKTHSPAAAPVPKPAYPAGLTAREVEVLRLVARGLRDSQVASRLVVSSRTVNSHLTSIYNKLGVTSRTAATRFAVDHDLD